MSARRTFAAVSVLALIATGCGAGDEGRSSDSHSAAKVEAPTTTEQGGGVRARALPATRDVIHTARVQLRAKDVPGAVARAAQLTRAAGGTVFTQQTYLDGSPRAEITVKVPPASFEVLLDRLSTLGELTDRVVEATDVSDQVLDLESRLRSAQASLARVRAFYDRAGSVAEVVTVEAELGKRQATVETLAAQVRALRDRTDLATITVALSSPPKPGAATAVNDDIPSFRSGLRAGTVTFINAVQVALAVVGALLPWLAALALVWTGLRRGRRWRLERRQVAAPT